MTNQIESDSIAEKEAASFAIATNNNKNMDEGKNEWDVPNQDLNKSIDVNPNSNRLELPKNDTPIETNETKTMMDDQHKNDLDYNAALNHIWNNLPFDEHYNVQDIHDDKTMETNHTPHCGSTDTKQTNASMIQNAIHKTKELLTRNFESIHSQALKAFHQNDTLQRQVDQLQSLADQRLDEIHRLKALESNHRTSLNNLLQALETSKQSCHDYSKHVRTECHLRNDITTLKKERDTLKETCTIQQNKISKFEEEIKMLKDKMTTLMKEKIKVERESRAALLLAKNLDGYNASDIDYYKRKVHELNDHVSSKNIMIAELERQLEDYKRQMERSFSQNHLARIRSESISHSRNSSSNSSNSADLSMGKRRRKR